MKTKTEQAVNLFKLGFFKEAVSIFKTFRIGFTKDEKRVLEIASDCLNGRSLLYKQLGIDTDKMISDCSMMIKAKYKL